MPKVYLASPLGFTPSTRDFMSTLEELIEGCGYAVVNPWRINDAQAFEVAAAIGDAARRRQALHDLNTRIGAANEDAIRGCDVVVAVLDGTDVDSGTASEVGFAAALGRRIYGYRGDMRRSGDNEASVVNLQVQYWIEQGGGCIVATLDDLRRRLTVDTEET